jgi:hypothetical protein
MRFTYLCSNIPSSPAYGVYISHLIQYARACSTYNQFLIRGCLLTNELMSQGFLQSPTQTALRKFYGHYNDLVCPYNLPLSQMLSDVFHTNRWAVLDALILTTVCTVYLIWKLGLTAGVTGQQGYLLPLGTWSHLWYIQRYVFAHSLICIFFRTYEIDKYLLWYPLQRS